MDPHDRLVDAAQYQIEAARPGPLYLTFAQLDRMFYF
jgi:hypothetical protein